MPLGFEECREGFGVPMFDDAGSLSGVAVDQDRDVAVTSPEAGFVDQQDATAASAQLGEFNIGYFGINNVDNGMVLIQAVACE